MNAFEKIEQVLLTAKVDAEKFYGRGNQSAGVRLRKAYQEIKALAHEGRKEVTAKKQ